MPMCDEETGWCVWWTLQRSRFCFGSARGGSSAMTGEFVWHIWYCTLYGIENFQQWVSLVVVIGGGDVQERLQWWLVQAMKSCHWGMQFSFSGDWRGHWGMPFRVTIEIAMMRDHVQLLSPKKVCSQKSTIKWTQTKIENTQADMARWCRQSPTHPYHPLHPLHPRYC